MPMSVGRMHGKNMTDTLAQNTPDDSWDMIIQPQRGLLDLRLAELWKYRDLVMLFVRRDFVAVYKQTILGPLWYLIQPLLTTITFTVIFGQIASLPTDGLPQFLFYMSGTVVWAYFADCLNKTSNTFVGNANLFGKVYFPRMAVPVSILLSNLITFAIQFGMFLAFVGFFAVSGTPIAPNWLWIALSPVLILMMAGLGLGFGIIISSLTTKYRDLRFLVQFGVQLWMYATPVIYPLSTMSPGRQWIMAINPITSIVEAFKYGTMGVGTFSWGMLGYSFGFMVVLLVVGIVVFNKVQRSFMDTV
jgi:lipopolysaccharide transport system permease protein